MLIIFFYALFLQLGPATHGKGWLNQITLFVMGVTTGELPLFPPSWYPMHCQGLLTLNASFHLQPGARGIPELHRQCQAHWLASHVVLVGQLQKTYPKAFHHLQGGHHLVQDHIQNPKAEARQMHNGCEQRELNKTAIRSPIRFPKTFQQPP